MLLIFQKFITCDGRFGTLYVYHIRLMMHFLDEEINLPFFLLHSLKRMASNIQKRVQFLETTLYHHGLVKILIEHHLRKMGDNWEEFLVRNHFEEPKESPPESKPTRRSRRREISKYIEVETGKSIQEDSEEMISEKLAQIKKQLKKERIIRKYAKDRGERPSQPRQSHRLRGILKKTEVRQTGIINIEDEETPEIDPAQQQIYNYIESLERRASESRDRTPSPPKSEIDVLRRDKYELEVLNRHIKNENDILREQVKLKSDMNSTLSLQMENLYKANEKVKKKNKKLIKALTNLRFKLVIRKPRRQLTIRKSRRRGLDVLAEVLEYME